MKNRFKVNDQITQFRNNQPIRIGKVLHGPFRVENIDHYRVDWEWEHKDYGTPEPFTRKDNLICDMVSTKYHYN